MHQMTCRSATRHRTMPEPRPGCWSWRPPGQLHPHTHAAHAVLNVLQGGVGRFDNILDPTLHLAVWRGMPSWNKVREIA